jgi:hypothetical protein
VVCRSPRSAATSKRGCRPPPADWELVDAEGPGPFVTRARYRRPDGVEVEWTSRRHRKNQGVRLVQVPLVELADRVVELGEIAADRSQDDVVDPSSHPAHLVELGVEPVTVSSLMVAIVVCNRPDVEGGPGTSL